MTDAGLLLPTSPSHTTYAGYIRVPGLAATSGRDGDAWVRLDGVKTKAGRERGQLLRGARLVLEPDLEELLQPHASTLSSRLRDAPSVPAFLAELRALASRAVAEQVGEGATAPPALPPPPALTAAAAAAVEAAGSAAWAALASASPCGTRLGFEMADDAGRTHELTVRFDPDFLSGRPPRLAAALPTPLRVELARGAASAPPPPLTAALAAWRAALAQHADFWACVDGIDARFRVLDPAPPTPADTHRVLALTGGASLEVELDARRPRSLPTGVAFMGAPSATAAPQAALDAYAWDEGVGPADNLAAALGEWLLPSAAAATAAATTAAMEEEPTGAECAICYAYHLPADGDGAATAVPPSVHCPHARCGRPYHAACLRGWLASLPGARAALGQLSGDCPYCGQEVAVPVGGGGGE